MEKERNIQIRGDTENQDNEFATARVLFDKQRYGEALTIYLRLAETQRGSSIYNRIAWMYEFGKGTERNSREAERWYERAANAGIAAGYYCLASMHLRKGKDADVRELMEHAAAQRYSPALFHLATMYRFGQGVPVDLVKAYEYCEQAAAQGHIFAQRQIAQRYIRGEFGIWGVAKGYIMVAKIMWTGFKLKLKDPANERLRRIA
jgi:TPR repeat protein